MLVSPSDAVAGGRRIDVAGPIVRSGGSSTLRAAAARVGSLTMFGVIPAGLTIYLYAAGGHAFAYDFDRAFWPAGRDVLHGFTPYVDPTSPDVARGVAFIFPAVAALLLAPFALLGRTTADHVFAALNVAAALLTLRALDVRDWRLYGFVLICPAVVYGWHLANVTMPIVLGVAAVWRWRDRQVVAGLLIALLVSVKLFVWPLGVWLLATRRYAAFAWAVGASVALNVASWMVLGFDEIARFQAVLGAFTRVKDQDGYSLIAIASDLGAGRNTAYALMMVVAGLLAAWCVRLGRAGRERCAMAACVALCLAASPIVWLPYFALLIVPLAIVRPRLSAVWWLPLPMWACPIVDPAEWQLVIALASAAALVGITPRPARRASSSSPPGPAAGPSLLVPNPRSVRST
ncbi:MAG: hypothetical protein JWO74_4193 [Solirubrobacterales bacterium]|nr:hypothetical protein [Solirubrobacterales bacterium]